MKNWLTHQAKSKRWFFAVKNAAKPIFNLSKIFISLLFVSALFSSQCFAATSTITLKASQTDLSPGDEITVSADLSEIAAIYALTATFQYDQNVFESISDANFTIPDTESIAYNADSNQFGIVNQSGEIDDDLFTIRLRVKDDANVGDTNIALTNISSSDGTNTTEYTTASTKVFVTRDVAEGEVVPTNQENLIAEGTTETQNVFFTTPFVVGAFIMVIIIILIAILYFGKLTPHTSRLFYWLIGIGAVILVLIAIITGINNAKKDVNEDGTVNYADAEAIIDYLISMQGNDTSSDDTENDSNTSGNNSTTRFASASNYLPSKRPSSYDVNNDGQVDISDAGHVAEETKKETKVEFANSDDQPAYVEKGEKTLKFAAKIEPEGVTLDAVKIGDHYYNVDHNNGIYTVELSAPFEQAGKQDYVISEAITSNQKTFYPDLHIRFEVLKSLPSFINFNLDVDNKTLSFDLYDPDHAFSSGHAEIYKNDESGDKIAETDIVPNSTTTIQDEDLEDDKHYHLDILGQYCLTEDQDFNNGYCFNDNRLITSHEFMMTRDYNFTLTNFSASDYVEQGENPIINFKSTNSKNIPIYEVKVRIDGAEHTYKISDHTGDNYEVVLDESHSKPGQHAVSLVDVTMESLQTFSNPQDFQTETLTYVVPENAPTVSDLILEHPDGENHIKVNFKLQDTKNTVSKITLVMTDSADKIIARKEYSREEIPNLLASGATLEFNDRNTDRHFTVKVLADYDLGDKYQFADQELSEGTISAFKDDDIIIENIYTKDLRTSNNPAPTLYAEKGQKKFQLGMTVKAKGGVLKPSNPSVGSYKMVSSITVNGNNYTASNESISQPVTMLGIPQTSGVITLTISRLQFMANGYYHKAADWYTVPAVTHRIEVLKDEPEIKNLQVEEDYANHKVTFNFDVKVDDNAVEGDQSFISGLIKLGNQEQVIVNRGHNSIEFTDVEIDQPMDLIFKASYDRDTDTLNADDNNQDRNEFKDKEIFKTSYGLYSDDKYSNISIDDGAALTNSKEINDEYFEKNEEIGLYFYIKGLPTELNSKPAKVSIQGKEDNFDLIQVVDADGVAEPDSYAVMMPGVSQSGRASFTITGIVFDSGKKVELQNPATIYYEVLKDPIAITDFKYDKNLDEIKIQTTPNDPDNSLVGNAHVKITDEQGQTLYDRPYSPEFSFEYGDSLSSYYYVTITGDYSRSETAYDHEKKYYHKDVELLKANISFEENYIELKDIKDISLYKITNDGAILTDEISLEEIKKDLDQYFVSISMENMPTVRVKLKGAQESNGGLYLILDSDHLTMADEMKAQNLQINFGTIGDNGKARNESHPDKLFNEFLDKLEHNQDVKLTRDLDADAIPAPTLAYYIEQYSGTIDGDGHKIINLSKQLFNQLSDGAEIKNLTIENASITGGVRGLIANRATNTKIHNVHIYNSNIVANGSSEGNGMMFGDTRDNIEITESSIVNATISGGKRTGGFIGQAYDKIKLNDCYIADSTISAGNNDAIGGLIGEVQRNKGIDANISNCYSQVEFNSGNGTAKAGIVGYSNNGNATKLNNSVSLAQGSAGNKVYGNNTSINPTNVYELEESTLTPDSQRTNKIKSISAKDINASFFKDTLSWNDGIWQLDDISIDHLPSFKNENFTVEQSKYAVAGNEYHESNEKLYDNVSKIMPYYEIDKIVKVANRLKDSDLQTKEIQLLVPMDASGNVVTYLTKQEPNKVTELKVIYTDGSIKTYNAIYSQTYDMVASYRIPALHLDYNFPHYVIDADSRTVDNLTYYLKRMDYNNNLDTLTNSDDSRIYRDFYNDITSKELKDFVLKYLASSNTTNTTNDTGINNQIESEVKQNHQIEKALYVYNYLRRFYDLDIDGLKLYDLMLFNTQNSGTAMTADQITKLFFRDENNFKTMSTNNTYQSVFSSYTNYDNLAKFIDFAVGAFGHGQTTSEWVKSQFKGYLVELPVSGHEQEIQYTLWDHLSHPDQNHGSHLLNQILPILTLPKNSTYIISSPVQFIIGSQRSYIIDPNDPAQFQSLKHRISTYSTRIQRYFTTAYTLLQDINLLNNLHLYHLDKRITYDENGGSIYNLPFSTTDDFHKNYNEVMGGDGNSNFKFWAASDGNAAVAWGDMINWSAEGLMDGNIDPNDGTVQEYTYHTFTHETAHNIDARLWLRNQGRRFNAGGEDYADSNLMQSFGANDIVMNLSVDWGENCDYGSNCSPDRIDTPNEIQDFYSKVFDVIYTLDYIEALAFLQLDSQTMSDVAVQVSYPYATGEDFNNTGYETYKAYFPDGLAVDEARAGWQAYKYTRYRQIAPEKFDEMKQAGNLDDINDLYDNQLMIYPGVYQMSTRGDNSYGGEGLAHVHWYQPHNDYGRPDSYALKWLAYEMLGYAGYDKGYIQYNSNIDPVPTEIYNSFGDISKGQKPSTKVDKNYKTDLIALRRITNDDDITFEEYKKNRFQEIEQKLKRLNPAIDVKAYVAKFHDAFIKDAEHAKQRLSQLIPDGTMNNCGYWCVRGVQEAMGKPYSSALRQEIYQKLKKMTNDFRDDGIIYTTDAQQNFNDISELRHLIENQTTD